MIYIEIAPEIISTSYLREVISEVTILFLQG